LAGHSPANDAVAPVAIAPATNPASDSVRQSALPFNVLVNIKLLLFDCCDADRDGRRLGPEDGESGRPREMPVASGFDSGRLWRTPRVAHA
jgi:hypothetical protein